MEFIRNVAAALVIIFGDFKVIYGTMTAETFLSFIAVLFMLYTPIKSIA